MIVINFKIIHGEKTPPLKFAVRSKTVKGQDGLPEIGHFVPDLGSIPGTR